MRSPARWRCCGGDKRLMEKADCNHIARMRTDNGKRTEYLCAHCGDRWTAARNGGVPMVPRNWRNMDQGELAVWYTRNVLKAKL